MNIIDLSLKELSAALAGGEVTSVECTKVCLDRIEQTSWLNNFITLCADAVECAERADKMRRHGNVNALCGVPIAVKDNIDVCGTVTSCASRFCLNGKPAATDAAVIQKLKRLGVVIIGKTNMDEFAMGSTNEYSAFGGVKNFRDLSRVAGGSSGGSANSVAARQVPCALGSDSGGSVRQPAAYCGVVGLKPTYAAVNTCGLMGLSPSFDHIGTFTRDCDDALMLYGGICENAAQLPTEPNGDICGKTIGVLDGGNTCVQPGVETVFAAATEKLKSFGANIIKISIPSLNAALAAYHVISSSEAAETFCERAFCGDTSLLGGEVKRRLITGKLLTVGSRYDDLYIKAAKVRAVIKGEFEKALCCCDALISPTSPTTAVKFGGIDPQKTHGNDVFTVAVGLAGLPAVSVPCGLTDGLPVGMQIIGNRFKEAEILGIGKAVMRVAGTAVL